MQFPANGMNTHSLCLPSLPGKDLKDLQKCPEEASAKPTRGKRDHLLWLCRYIMGKIDVGIEADADLRRDQQAAHRGSSSRCQSHHCRELPKSHSHGRS